MLKKNSHFFLNLSSLILLFSKPVGKGMKFEKFPFSLHVLSNIIGTSNLSGANIFLTNFIAIAKSFSRICHYYKIDGVGSFLKIYNYIYLKIKQNSIIKIRKKFFEDYNSD